MIRTTVAHLEREGLIRSDPALMIEVTDAGRAALRAARDA
jgi:Mn-dependent DtxR family transcriptional regulator